MDSNHPSQGSGHSVGFPLIVRSRRLGPFLRSNVVYLIVTPGAHSHQIRLFIAPLTTAQLIVVNLQILS